MIADDATRMVAALERQSSRTPIPASLFLFALSTGSRRSSCSKVRLRDIRGVITMLGFSSNRQTKVTPRRNIEFMIADNANDAVRQVLEQ